MPRSKRRTENQQLFREVNDRIAELWTVLDEREEPLSVVCECWRVGCMERGAVPLEIYGRARDGSDLFVVVCGHEDHGDFVLVRPFDARPS